MKLYLLSQCDVRQTKSTFVLFGVFESHALAVGAAKKLGLYHYEAQVIIQEIELNQVIQS